MFTKVLGQRSGVDTIYPYYLFLLEPIGKATVSLPVAVVISIVLGYYGLAVDAVALVILADFIFLPPGRHSVIAEYGISRDQYLPSYDGSVRLSG